MSDCTPGEIRTHKGRREQCIGGKWVPLPPIPTPPGSGPETTFVVKNKGELLAKLQSDEIARAMDRDDSEVVVHILPKAAPADDGD